MKHRPFPSLKFRGVVGLAAALAAAAIAGPAHGEDRHLGSFSAWDAWTTEVEGNKTCYIAALPQKSDGNYSERGETSVLVAHFPDKKQRNVISIVAGYDYKKDSEVRVDIDGQRLDLFTSGDRAWAYTTEHDNTLVQNMRRGLLMIVRGTSTRGTRTTDTYSLKGFTAAHKAISDACGTS